MSKLYAITMAGGSGTRFWPASRAMRPKQLLPLSGATKRSDTVGAPTTATPEHGSTACNDSLLAQTIARIEPLIPRAQQYIVTAARLGELTSLHAVGVPEAQILREPSARNTAPCIAWATWEILQRDLDARIVVLPSDHFITNEPEFLRVIEMALTACAKGRLMTIGIVPTRPETGYGYIEVGSALAGGACVVQRFVEKPNATIAEQYVTSGNYLWNAGMFVYEARAMQRAIRQWLPEIATGMDALMADRSKLDTIFPALQAISIDNGVMEKSENLGVIPGDFGWNDVGSWQSTWDLATRDENDNALPAHAVSFDAKRNLVHLSGNATGKTVALVGVSDLVVVDTGDALLVMPRERAQDVRLVVEALKSRGSTELM
jgi:mannose-1-phosphate guanylyltransferase